MSVGFLVSLDLCEYNFPEHFVSQGSCHLRQLIINRH